MCKDLSVAGLLACLLVCLSVRLSVRCLLACLPAGHSKQLSANLWVQTCQPLCQADEHHETLLALLDVASTLVHAQIITGARFFIVFFNIFCHLVCPA